MPDSPFGTPEGLAPFGDETRTPRDQDKYVPPRGYRPRRSPATPPPVSTASPQPSLESPAAVEATARPTVLAAPTVPVPQPVDVVPVPAPAPPVAAPPEQYEAAFAAREQSEAFVEAAPAEARGRGRLVALLAVLVVTGGGYGGWLAAGSPTALPW